MLKGTKAWKYRVEVLSVPSVSRAQAPNYCITLLLNVPEIKEDEVVRQ